MPISAYRIKRLKGHTSYVNSVHPARRGEPMIVSGSDDCMIKVWDQRKRNAAQSLNNMYQVTAVTFNDTTDQVSRCVASISYLVYISLVKIIS